MHLVIWASLSSSSTSGQAEESTSQGTSDICKEGFSAPIARVDF